MVANNRVEVTGELAALADRLAKGETLVLTREGREVGLVTPLRAAMTQAHDPAKAQAALEELFRLRQGVTTGGIPVKEMVEEGRA